MDCDKEIVIGWTKKNGYIKIKNNKGYSKKVKGGRLHLIFDKFEEKLVVELHYDKFKGNRRKKHHHSVQHDHHLVKGDAQLISNELKVTL